VVRSAARRATEAERKRFAELADRFEKSARQNDDTTFMRVDREYNDLSVSAAKNEFAAGAMSLMHSLSRRFWYMHYKQAADLPLCARLHAAQARAIADGDVKRASEASDRLIDYTETFTRATVGATMPPPRTGRPGILRP
jgi:DNA-binding GntR family transcriptional regulator